MVSCYAIDLFFVECVYAVDKNKITEVRSFKSGPLLDKFSPNLKCKY